MPRRDNSIIQIFNGFSEPPTPYPTNKTALPKFKTALCKSFMRPYQGEYVLLKFSPNDDNIVFRFVSRVMDRLPWWDSYNVAYFEMEHVKVNDVNRGVHIHAVMKDGTRENEIAFKDAMKGRSPSPEERWKRTMRRTVRYQSRAWKQTADHDSCRRCSTKKNLQADHIYALDHIIREFEQIMPRDYDDFRYVEDHFGDTVFAPGEYKDAWCEYHQRIARFQYLCGPCNASKGKK